MPSPQLWTIISTSIPTLTKSNSYEILHESNKRDPNGRFEYTYDQHFEHLIFVLIQFPKTTYSQVSISVTPISVIISYILRKFYSPTKTHTIGKTSECYVLSVITCFTPFFVNYTSISVNFEKIKVAIVCQCGKF